MPTIATNFASDLVTEVVLREPDVDRAVSEILRRLERSEESQSLWNDETARFLVASRVHRERHVNREASAAWMTPEKAKNAERVIVRSMLDDYTIGNKRLGDCARADLAQHRDWCASQRRGWAIKTAFVEAIVAKMPNDDMLVRDVVTNEQLISMHRQAEGGAQ